MYIEQGGFLNWACADQYGEGNDTFLLQLDSLQEAYAYVTGDFNLVEGSSMDSGTPRLNIEGDENVLSSFQEGDTTLLKYSLKVMLILLLSSSLAARTQAQSI